ncbi:MAG: efflux RND transporter periplasmic adaptor subunit, partial [Flavobacterium sp.]
MNYNKLLMRYSFLILITFFLFTISSSCTKKNKDEIQPSKGTITQSVYASGVVKSENQYTVYPTVNGVLQKINIAVGQSIAQGQSLFQIESEKASLNTENARLAYQLSQEGNRFIQDKIAEMETKVQAAKDKLTLDESVYKRNKNIKQYNVISEVDYEKVELAYKNSKSNYEATVKQLGQLKSQLNNDQSRSNINLKLNEKSQSDFNIKSTFSGELYDVLVKEGTLVTTQTPLAVIGKKNFFLLELDVDENDMAQVQLGQKMEVTMDSYKGKVFEA